MNARRHRWGSDAAPARSAHARRDAGAERPPRWLKIGGKVAAALLGAALAAAAHALAPTAEEYAVLSAVLTHGLPPETKAIAISSQTIDRPEDVLPPSANLETLAQELATTPALLQVWRGLNRAPATLEQHFSLTAKVELIEPALRAKIFTDTDPAASWARFHKRFPHAAGLLSVSRVALDDTNTNALVYVEFACGPTCGTGRLVRLSRQDHGWSVISGELMWVAGE